MGHPPRAGKKVLILCRKRPSSKSPKISPFQGLFGFRHREHVWTVKAPSKRKQEVFPVMFWATRDNGPRDWPPENEKLAILLDERRVSGGTQLVDQRLHIAMKCRVYLDADDILPQSLLWKKTRKASTRAAHIEYDRSASVA